MRFVFPKGQLGVLIVVLLLWHGSAFVVALSEAYWSGVFVNGLVLAGLAGFCCGIRDGQWMLCSIYSVCALARLGAVVLLHFIVSGIVMTLLYGYVARRFYCWRDSPLPEEDDGPSRRGVQVAGWGIALAVAVVGVALGFGATLVVRRQGSEWRTAIFDTIVGSCFIISLGFVFSLISILRRKHVRRAAINCIFSLTPIALFFLSKLAIGMVVRGSTHHGQL